jgi:pre-mRNA branch site protein p14
VSVRCFLDVDCTLTSGVCRGTANDTRGTAFVVYEDIYDAKNAVDHLSGFNVCGRYLIVLYYQATKMQQKLDADQQRRELEEIKAKYGVTTDE